MKEKSKYPGSGGSRGGGKLFRVVVRDPGDGELGGLIWVGPTRRGWWAAAWSVDTLDRQYDLSDHWFTRRAYYDALGRLLDAAARSNPPGCMECSANVRWGSVWGLREEVALDFARGLWELWKRVVDEWGAARAGAVKWGDDW